MKISQRAAKISITFNIILVILCFVLFIYANFQRTFAEQQHMIAYEEKLKADSVMIVAKEQQEMAIRAREMAEQQRQLADSAAAAARNSR